MKALVIGSGGREHALVWKLKHSNHCNEVWCAPGNAGIYQIASTVSIAVDEIDQLVRFAGEKQFDLVVVGPEMPLAEGIVDAMRAAGLTVFGPTKAAAQIESSKRFARNLMATYQIPTPEYQAFTDPSAAKSYVRELEKRGLQCVVKADGLAAGKGAIVTSSTEEADKAIDLCMIQKEFGEAGNVVVIEERLKGPELSILAVTDGNKLVILPPAQDHKPIGEGDTGPNTGGMGAYSPVPLVTEELMQTIQNTILEPTIRGMEAEGIPYTGVLYAGLMICNGKPYVIEFNCRFGDPETQAVLPVTDIDLFELLVSAAKGELSENRVIQASEYAVCVVMASGGYPGPYEKGKVINGLEWVSHTLYDSVVVFHAGTRWREDKFVTSGGRVLGITGLGADFDEAYKNAYAAIRKIHFENAYYRTDIGYRVRSK